MLSESQSVDHFVCQLKRRQVHGSNYTALETAQLIRTVISSSRWNNASSLITNVRELAIRLINAQPVEFAVGNVLRRVLHLIREEYKNISRSSSSTTTSTSSSTSVPVAEMGEMKNSFGTTGSTMFNLISSSSTPCPIDYNKQCLQLKQLVIQGINEIIDELESVNDTLAQQSLDHIHTNEIIMTIGRSKAVEKFLLSAAKKRKFQVIVAEGSPNFGGHQLCKNLAVAGVETCLIADNAIFALMARVNKVIIGCHAVTANGGLIAPSGYQLIANAAAHHSTPVCVVTGLYKLSPIFPENHKSYNLLSNPSSILPFSDGKIMQNVHIINPQFDYVPSKNVNLFITNTGAHPPSYIYRLLREMYDIEDYILE